MKDKQINYIWVFLGSVFNKLEQDKKQEAKNIYEILREERKLNIKRIALSCQVHQIISDIVKL